jgi:DNA-binding CsgD family transcriptional regulator
MERDRVARRAHDAIVRLAYAGLDARTLRVEATRAMRRLVPLDALFFATVDPETLLFTGSVVEEIPEHATAAFLTNELLTEDVNKFMHLAHADQPVQSLFAATEGRPDDSPRYREILVPLGFGDELRAALRVDATTWGVLCVHRELGSPEFTPSEAAFVRQIAPHLAVGLRSALLLEASAVCESDGPGLVMLADDLSVASTTATADRWLAELGDWPRRSEPPQALRAVAARLLAIEQCDRAAVLLPPRVRVHAPSGRWLTLHAARLSGVRGADAIAVIIEPASAPEVMPLVLQAYSLTAREAQVAQLVLHGRPTSEIAAQLSITALTVQQHLKAVFEKTGVRSRRELIAQVFAQQYLPRLVRT